MTFTSAYVHVRKVNRLAKMISFFVIHVPDGSSEYFKVALEPVTVCSSSKNVKLNLVGGKFASDYFLGAKIERTVELFGHDEVGRSVGVKIVF